MFPKKEVYLRKASEATMSRMVASLMGFAGTDLWREAKRRAVESRAADSIPWNLEEVELYPWTVSVPKAMFEAKKTDELMIHLAANPGSLFLVNDSSLKSKDGLWLMVADDALQADNNAGYAATQAPVMMLANHVFFDFGTYLVTAVQLKSCLRSLT